MAYLTASQKRPRKPHCTPHTNVLAYSRQTGKRLLKIRIRVAAGRFLMNSALRGQREAEKAPGFSNKMEMGSNLFVRWD